MSNLYFIKNNTFRVHQSTFQRWLTQSSMSLGSLGWSSALLRLTSSTSEIQTRPTSTLRWTSTWHCYGLPLSSPFSTWSSPSSPDPSTWTSKTFQTQSTSSMDSSQLSRSHFRSLSFMTWSKRYLGKSKHIYFAISVSRCIVGCLPRIFLPSVKAFADAFHQKVPTV